MPQPSYQSAEGFVGESSFTMTFDVALDDTHPPFLGSFSIQINGTGVAVASVSVDGAGKTVTVGFSTTLLTGDIIEFSYTDPTGGNDANAIQAGDGTDATSFSSAIVIFDSRPPTCFLRGTRILTDHGEVRVEALRAGDRVATRFGGLRPIRWIGTQSFDARFAGRTSTPIRLAAGSLGPGLPRAELHVSPGHAMLLDDVLVHAGALVNGTTITQPRPAGDIDYFHLDLGPHDCVLANGAWAESYFEDRNRNSFHNVADFHARFPDHRPVRQSTCRPILTADHPQIAAIRASLPGAIERFRSAA